MAEQKGISQRAALLAGAALIADVIVLFLPLHIGAVGEFEDAFPSVGTRLTIGFLIQDFTPAVMIAAGLFLLWWHRPLIASGVFLAVAIFSVLHGATAPSYALVRAQPLLLKSFRILIGILLFVAAWQCTRRPTGATLPKPPPSVMAHSAQLAGNGSTASRSTAQLERS